MFKVIEATLKSNDPVIVEVPYGSQPLGLIFRDNVPRVLLKVPVGGVLIQVKFITVTTGEVYEGEIGENPKYVGTFNLVQKLPNPIVGGPPLVISAYLHVFAIYNKGESNVTGESSGSSIILP